MRTLAVSFLFAIALFGGCSGSAIDDPLGGGDSSAGAHGGATGAGGPSHGGAQSAGGTSASLVGAGGMLNVVGMGGGSGDDACGDVGKVIYVVSSEHVLLSFAPQAMAFTKIGTLSCPATPGASPFSMAVNRAGVAYVLYDDGNIFLVQTTDASCQSSAFPRNQKGFLTFGMGWVSDAAGSDAETLFVIDGSSTGSNNNKGLASIDFNASLTPIGNFNMGLGGRTAEVTGRGDGRLFGFFVDITDASKSSVAEIDKGTAKILSNFGQNLPTINAWAFAHWGGSFYLFNGTGQEHSRVHKFDPTMGPMGTTTQIVDDAGYRIVGAGVSTCAPLVEPPIH